LIHEPALKSREAEHYLGDSGSRLVFAWQACRPEPVWTLLRPVSHTMIVETIE